jgi:hypothetical protein
VEDTMPTSLSVAVSYVQAGWAVIPVYGVGPDGICRCRDGGGCMNSGKHPIQRGWTKGDALSVADLYAIWDEHPDANVGLRTGDISRMWVLDVEAAGLEDLGRAGGHPRRAAGHLHGGHRRRRPTLFFRDAGFPGTQQRAQAGAAHRRARHRWAGGRTTEPVRQGRVPGTERRTGARAAGTGLAGRHAPAADQRAGGHGRRRHRRPAPPRRADPERSAPG